MESISADKLVEFETVEQLIEAQRLGNVWPADPWEFEKKKYGRIFTISKDKRQSRGDYLGKAKFDKDTYKLLEVRDNGDALSQEERKFMKLFEEMWIFVPTPFRTGDLVVSPEDGPAALYDWKLASGNTEYVRRMEQEGDFHDMQCSVRDMAKGAYNLRNSSIFYLRLEHYKETAARKTVSWQPWAAFTVPSRILPIC